MRVQSLALDTIEVVAKRLHPERRDPLLQFTVPEALAVIERASVNLRGFLISSFPLGDRITVAQLMWLYRWRGALSLAEKGYDLWRIVRLLNPVAAATQELRERFTRQIYDMGTEHLARRLARAFVKEVGRAAIDLYGGNLRVTEEQLTRHVTAASRKDFETSQARDAEPVRILVAGQTGAGKSSLVNALANAVEAAVDVAAGNGRFHGLQADARGPTNGADHRQPRPDRQGRLRSADRGGRRLRPGALGVLRRAGRTRDRRQRALRRARALRGRPQPASAADAARADACRQPAPLQRVAAALRPAPTRREPNRNRSAAP